MKLREIFNSAAIALNYTEVASNGIPYLGSGLFPSQKKAGLDLKWLKGHNGLPVSLAPSNFDAKSTFRDRVGVEQLETEMPFFRESMLIKEKDEQEIMRVQDSNDPYAQQVLDNIFNDTRNLVNGADVVPERMIMQLLAPIGGDMGIQIKTSAVGGGTGANYTYNYDPDGSWKAKHYTKITTPADKWSAAATCDPVRDIEAALDAQEQETGTRPDRILISKATFDLCKASVAVRNGILAQNATPNVNYTTKRVRAYMEEELGVTFVIYNKMYKDEAGVAHKFYPDNILMMFPAGSLGRTWYGTTPEERTLAQTDEADVSIVNTGVAITVTTTSDPVNTKTTVSEIVLPSFERMDECCALEVV